MNLSGLRSCRACVSVQQAAQGRATSFRPAIMRHQARWVPGDEIGVRALVADATLAFAHMAGMTGDQARRRWRRASDGREVSHRHFACLSARRACAGKYLIAQTSCACAG